MAFELCRVCIRDQPDEVQVEIRDAFARGGFPNPMTPAQMQEWQVTVDAIIAKHSQVAS